ncbi:MAG: Protein with response regulator receiver domain [Deltaproteobacteria bacterium]|nr:Protein with response regulator receiver domain [Deltaproteobacteria bacterium]
MGGDVQKDFKLIIDNEEMSNVSAPEAATKEELQRWPLFGLSVGSFLQVIAMEQQTCIMEVYLNTNNTGHFCFVEGELYDAVCGSLTGEDAAMEMIAWENVRLNIKQILNTSSVDRKIDKNLMLLMMESSRRRDEVQENGEHADLEMEDVETLEDAEVVADDVERTKLDTCLNLMSKDMGDALRAASIINMNDGKVMAFYNDDPDTAQSFMRLTTYMKTTYSSETPFELGDHLIIDLKDQQTLVILMIDEYQWNIIFNNVKCSLGMLRNIIMPKVIRTFNEMNVG